VSYLDAQDERKRQLEQRHPGWQIWYVPLHGQRATTWCGRPWPLLNEDSPEALSAAIEAAGVRR
jgi:hypothetical protein